MIYRRVLRYYRPFLGSTLAGLVFSLIGIGVNLLKPWPVKVIVDQILPQNSAFRATHANWHSYILPLCLAIVGLQLLWGLINLLTNYIFVKVGLQALLKLRTDLYSYLQSLSLKYHDARRSADSSFRVAYDSQAIQTIYNKGFTNIFGSVITLVGIFVIMLQLDWQLTLLSLGIVPLIVGAIYFFAHRIRTESTSIQEQDSAMLTQAQEGLSSIRMVAAFGREDFEVSQFHQSAQRSLQANLKLTLTNVQSALVITTLMGIGTAAMWYLGTLHVLTGTLTLGSLILFSSYLVMLYQPLQELTYTAWAMEGATAGAQRCFEVLDREDDVRDSPGALAITETKAAIAFDQVSFAYNEKSPVLDGINLHISPNQIVALVGGTGGARARCSVSCRVSTIQVRASSRSMPVMCARSPKSRSANKSRSSSRTRSSSPPPSARTLPMAVPRRPTRRSVKRRGARRRMISYRACLMATTARSANAADISASVNVNASASRALF